MYVKVCEYISPSLHFICDCTILRAKLPSKLQGMFSFIGKNVLVGSEREKVAWSVDSILNWVPPVLPGLLNNYWTLSVQMSPGGRAAQQQQSDNTWVWRRIRAPGFLGCVGKARQESLWLHAARWGTCVALGYWFILFIPAKHMLWPPHWIKPRLGLHGPATP